MSRVVSSSAELLLAHEGDVMHLTLHRPDKGNALSRGLVAALMQALEAAREARIRLLVLSGNGKHFCTGFDLSGLDQEDDDSLLSRFTRVELLLQALHTAPFTTLALAHGRTMGAGADLFCACANRWMVGETSFAFPGAAFGLVLGTTRLARTVGSTQAHEWIEAGARIDSGSALRTGLATRQVEAQTLDAEVAALVQRTARLEADTQRAIQQAIEAAQSNHGEAAQAQDLLRLVQSAARPGIKTRIAAYRAALTQA
ncbi:MAG: enoyl-CoA hydratase/isomerase family protein [Polaromonas sp.]